MITEDYVSFETAKLLKEKWFDGNCYKVWAKESKSEPELYAAPNFVEGETTASRESVEDAERFMNGLNLSEYKIEGYLAPTIQMAMKWLREVHNIDINIYAESISHKKRYTISIWKNIQDDDAINDVILGVSTIYEEACEAAVKYCLENLI